LETHDPVVSAPRNGGVDIPTGILRLPHRPHLRTNGRAANLHLDRIPGIAVDVQTVRCRESHRAEGLGPPGIGVDEKLGGRRRGRIAGVGVDADGVEVAAIREIEVHEGVEVPVV
jgi:hypothetical protein